MVTTPQESLSNERSPNRRYSIHDRLRELEINMVRNMETGNKSQAEIQAFRRQSKVGMSSNKLEAPRTNQAECVHSKSLGLCPTQHARMHGGRRYKGLGPLSGGSSPMNQRIAALQRSATKNDEIMQGHRSFLDMKKLQNASHANPDHFNCNENFVEAREVHKSAPNLLQSIPTNTTEALNMVVQMWNSNNFHLSSGSRSFSQRPSSAGSFGQCHDREISSKTQNEQRPDATVTSLVRVPGRPFSRTSSRPVSANSISSRCAAIQNNLERNQELLKTNRDDINLVVKLRKESREELGRTLLLPQSDLSPPC